MVVIPIKRWDRVAEKAAHFGLMSSNDIAAVQVITEDVKPRVQAASNCIPRLAIID